MKLINTVPTLQSAPILLGINGFFSLQFFFAQHETLCIKNM